MIRLLAPYFTIDRALVGVAPIARRWGYFLEVGVLPGGGLAEGGAAEAAGLGHADLHALISD
jgi:hypothetical protein